MGLQSSTHTLVKATGKAVPRGTYCPSFRLLVAIAISRAMKPPTHPSKQTYDRPHRYLHLHSFSESVRLVRLLTFLGQRHLDRKRLACLTCLHRRMDIAHGVCLPVSSQVLDESQFPGLPVAGFSVTGGAGGWMSSNICRAQFGLAWSRF